MKHTHTMHIPNTPNITLFKKKEEASVRFTFPNLPSLYLCHCTRCYIYTYVTIRSRYARCQCFRCFGCFDCTRTEKHVQRTLIMGSASTLIYLIGSSVSRKTFASGRRKELSQSSCKNTETRHRHGTVVYANTI